MFLQRLLSRKKDLTRVLFRESVYKARDLSVMVREICALANLAEKGERYIVFNATRDMNGELIFTAAERGTANDLKNLVDKVNRFIEPSLTVKPVFGDINGKLGAAIEITGCSNPPYMIRTDVAENFVPGSCWIKDEDKVRLAGRKDFDKLYGAEQTPSLAQTASQVVRIGFNGNPSDNYLKVQLPDISMPPSAMAAAKIQRTIDIRKANEGVADTGLLRLMHAKENLEFDDRGINTLVQGFNSVVSEHLAEDSYFHFETKAVKINLTVMNQMSEPLENPSVILTLPCIEQCRVSDRIYLGPQDQLTPKEAQIQGYPHVRYFNDTVRIAAKRGEKVDPEGQIDLFEAPLRLSCQPELRGKKLAMHFTLNADNLDKPVTGRLRLGFK